MEKAELSVELLVYTYSPKQWELQCFMFSSIRFYGLCTQVNEIRQSHSELKCLQVPTPTILLNLII